METQNTLRTFDENEISFENNYTFASALDPNKCLALHPARAALPSSEFSKIYLKSVLHLFKNRFAV